MKKLLLLIIASIGFTFSAQAEQPITIEGTIPIAKEAVETQETLGACDWNTRLSALLVTDAGGLIVATDKDLSQASGPVLALTITGVGSHGDVPDLASIHGELRSGGKVLSSLDTFATSHLTLATACDQLERISSALAREVAAWAKGTRIDVMPLLQSDSPALVDQAAHILFLRLKLKSEVDRPTLDAVAARIAKDVATEDSSMVEALSWLCKGLQLSRQGRYKAFMQHAVDLATTDKLRNYLTIAANALPRDGADPYRVDASAAASASQSPDAQGPAPGGEPGSPSHP